MRGAKRQPANSIALWRADDVLEERLDVRPVYSSISTSDKKSR
jgi:hypothetical protein